MLEPGRTASQQSTIIAALFDRVEQFHITLDAIGSRVTDLCGSEQPDTKVPGPQPVHNGQLESLNDKLSGVQQRLNVILSNLNRAI